MRRLKEVEKLQLRLSLNETPMFVKASSILPIEPKVQYATQKTDKPLKLKVYPGKDAEFVLYFDDNESYEYEKGVYSETELTYSESNKTLELKVGVDNWIHFAQNSMDFIIEVIGGKNQKITFKGKELKVSL